MADPEVVLCEVILPKSPWEQSLAEIEKDGVPTEDNVADIFEAIIPLLPTPHMITLDLHFWITLTAFSTVTVTSHVTAAVTFLV